MALKISFACGSYDRMEPLKDGAITPEGIDLDFIGVESPREIFDKMAGSQAFDASEMSTSEFVARTDAGQCPFVAIPIFPSKAFRHGFRLGGLLEQRLEHPLAADVVGQPALL